MNANVIDAPNLKEIVIVEDDDARNDEALTALGDARTLADGVEINDLFVGDAIDGSHDVLPSGLQVPLAPVVVYIMLPLVALRKYYIGLFCQKNAHPGRAGVGEALFAIDEKAHCEHADSCSKLCA